MKHLRGFSGRRRTIWWARAGVYAGGAILCSIIASMVVDARERRASAKTGAK